MVSAGIAAAADTVARRLQPDTAAAAAEAARRAAMITEREGAPHTSRGDGVMSAGWTLARGAPATLGASAGGGGGSADETKYDGRHLRERIFTLPRLVAAAAVLGLLVWLVEGGGREVATQALKRRKIDAPLAATVGALPSPPQQQREGPPAPEQQQPQPQREQPGSSTAPVDGGVANLWAKPTAQGGSDEWLPRPSGEGSRPGSGLRAPEAVKSDGDAGEAGSVPAEKFWKLHADSMSCDGFFGNGFTSFHPIEPAGMTGSAAAVADGMTPRLWCRSHPGTKAAYCIAQNLQVEPSLVTMSRGGEDLKAVMGRQEGDEVPHFADGAFRLLDGALVDSAAAKAGSGAADDGGPPLSLAAMVGASGLGAALERNDNFKRDMVRTTQLVKAEHHPCSHIIDDAVIMLSRMEYANLFHTSTGGMGGMTACVDAR